MKDTETKSKLLTRKEMLAELGISNVSLWRLEKDFGFPFTRIGKQKRYRRQDIERFLHENTYPMRPPNA